MAGQTVGGIQIDLSAQSAAFAADMAKASRSLNTNVARMNRRIQSMGRSFNAVLGIIGLVGGATGLVLLTKNAIKSADAIGQVADKVGFTTSALQELRFAAQTTGVAQNTLDMALQRFSRRVGEAAQGGGELKGILDQYNIAVKDSAGNTRNINDVLGDLADAIKNADSSQERLRISFKAFDSEGAALVNLMRKGASGLDKFRKRARDLGLVLSDNLIREAQRAQEQIDIMTKSIGVQAQRAFVALAPTIIAVGNAFAEVTPKITRFVESMLPLELLSRKGLTANLKELNAELKTLSEVQRKGGGGFLVARNLRKARAELEKEIAQVTELRDKLAAPFSFPVEETNFGTIVNEHALSVGVLFDTVEDYENALTRANAATMLTGEAARIATAGIDDLDASVRGAEFTFIRTTNAIEQTKLEIEDFDAAVKEAQLTFEQIKFAEDFDKARASSAQFAGIVASGFTQGIFAGEKLSDTLANIGRRLAAAIVQALLFRAIMASLGFPGQGTIPNIVPAPVPTGDVNSLALGGPVRPNTAHLVGERGPELFVPRGAGNVVPNNQLGGGGITIIMDNRGAFAGAEHKIGAAVRTAVQVAVRQAVGASADRRARGMR